MSNKLGEKSDIVCASEDSMQEGISVFQQKGGLFQEYE